MQKVDEKIMKLNLFKDIKGLNDEKLHPKVRLLKNELQLHKERDILIDWTEGLVDKDHKFIREFQETFHSTFWEIYLYKLFTDAGFVLDQSHQMPDYIIKSPEEIYIEAVVANIRENGVSENQRTIEDQLSMIVPPKLQSDFYQVLDEAIVRTSNAIVFKHQKYTQSYIRYDWIKEDAPYVIAVASFDQVNYGREYIYPILALLYGLYYDVDDGVYNQKSEILKPQSLSKIPIGIFLDKSYEEVSAIIFSCTLTLGKLKSLTISNGDFSINDVFNIHHNLDEDKYLLQYVSKDCPEDIADGVFVFHNPNAKNKLADHFFEKLGVTQFFFENNQLMYKGNVTPLMTRINTTKLLSPIIEVNARECVRILNKLDVDEFYDIDH